MLYIDGRNFFNQPINSMNKTYENIRKIAVGKGHDYATMLSIRLLLFILILQKIIR